MNTGNESWISGPDFDSLKEISRRLSGLERKKREPARAIFPDPDVVQELLEKEVLKFRGAEVQKS